MKFSRLYVLYALVSVSSSTSLYAMLSSIQKAVLVQEIELHGVEVIAYAMQKKAPMVYDEKSGLYHFTNTILTLKTDVYKTDVPDRLTQLVFNAVDHVENDSWPHRYANNAMPYGDFKPLEQHVDYAWMGESGERKAAVTVKVRYENKEAVKEVLDQYRK